MPFEQATEPGTTTALSGTTTGADSQAVLSPTATAEVGISTDTMAGTTTGHQDATTGLLVEQGAGRYALDGDGADEWTSRTLTASGGVTWIQGQHGQAAEFDGTGRLHGSRYGGIEAGQDTTIAYWVRIDSFPDSSAGESISLLLAHRKNKYHEYTAGVIDGELRMGYTGWGNDIGAAVVTGLNTGEWYHIIHQCDQGGGDGGNSGDVWVNNVKQPHIGYQGSGWMPGAGGSNGLALGGNTSGDADRFAQGALDDVRFYSRLLSSDERKRIYEAGGGSTTGIIEPAVLGRPAITAAPRVESTLTSETHTADSITNPVLALELIRLMLVATVDPGLRSHSVKQQQVFDGAIEHNDAARREAFGIERTVFPGSVRRVPSSPDVRLRKFETVTTEAHRQTTPPASLVELARLTTGTHMATHLSPQIGALVAMDARYPLGRTDITTAAFEPMDSTYIAALEQSPAITVSTSTNDTYRSVAPVVELFAPYWPIGNSVYSLTTPDITTMTATDVGKTMTRATAQAAVDGRPTKRATVQRLREAGVSPLALVLDARTPYPMVLVAADIFGEESGGTTVRPHDAGLGGLDTTEDVIFGSRTNGFSMQ